MGVDLFRVMELNAQDFGDGGGCGMSMVFIKPGRDVESIELDEVEAIGAFVTSVTRARVSCKKLSEKSPHVLLSLNQCMLRASVRKEGVELLRCAWR